MTTGIAEKAMQLFDSGYNCAESVLLASTKKLAKNRIIPCIATGFGGGVGRSGNICGALSGAVMAIGLRRGCRRAEEKEKRQATYDEVMQMIKEFKEEFGSSQCKKLTGCDFRTENGLERFRSQEIREKVCSNFVGWCATYVASKQR